MGEAIIVFFQSGDFWAVLVKILITALLTGLVGLLCTVIGKLIAKCKNSKLMKHARIAVRAAEQKFPNEGKKMGPEKIAYVMDYLAITFPKIKSNQYLYNIAEAAVYELNNENIKKEAEQVFKDKYGELPTEDEIVQEDVPGIEEITSSNAEETAKSETVLNEVSKTSGSFNLKSF